MNFEAIVELAFFPPPRSIRPWTCGQWSTAHGMQIWLPDPNPALRRASLCVLSPDNSPEPSFFQQWLYHVFSPPWIELIGLCLGLVTVSYLRKNDGGHGGDLVAGDGERRVALSQRIARGVPVLLATG